MAAQAPRGSPIKCREAQQQAVQPMGPQEGIRGKGRRKIERNKKEEWTGREPGRAGSNIFGQHALQAWAAWAGK